MATVGEIEKRTQARVVALFRDRLQYDYLGNWVDRDNRNVEQGLLAIEITARAQYRRQQGIRRRGA